jgi:uncharacterized protein YunC (DUF1805 family)
MNSLLVLDSATQLGDGARGSVAVCGSHGGRYPAWLAAHAGVRAAILNDAGLGKDGAGVAGIAWLDTLGIAACAVDAWTARIGDGADTLANGIVSTANEAAQKLGCQPGMYCSDAVRALGAAPVSTAEVPEIGQSRTIVETTGHRAVWALDSVSLARPSDRRAILLTGSHGALLGGRPDRILDMDVFAAFLNDAGGGRDGAGYARVALLATKGVAAATVWNASARIGDGRSTCDDGVLSRVNSVAERLGLHEGMTAREAVARLVGIA